MSIWSALVSGSPIPIEVPGIPDLVAYVRYMTSREAMKYSRLRMFAEGKKAKSVRNESPESVVVEAEELNDAQMQLLTDRTTKLITPDGKTLNKKAEIRKVYAMLPSDQCIQLTRALQDARELGDLLFRGDTNAGTEGSEGSKEEGSGGK